MRHPLVFYCSVYFAVLNYVQCAEILGLFPHTGKSHQMVFDPLLRRLAERGHHVTVVSFFPLKKPPANYTSVSLEGIATLGVETIDLQWMESPGILLNIPTLDGIVKRLTFFSPLADIALDVCGKLVDWPALTNALQKKYDLIMLESFNSDCVFGLLHLYGHKAPIIGLLSSDLMPWTADRVGLIENPSYVPVLGMPSISSMTLLERIDNTFRSLYYKYWFRYRIQNKEQEIIEKHFGKKIPQLDVLAKNMSLLLTNTFHTLNGAKPRVPAIVDVGGMHLDPTKKVIPEYIEKFLNESDHGVVLFSFGSLIKTATMPQYKQEILINSLSKLKQRVIWKFEDSGEQGTLTGNILRVRWLPQYELLQHNKVVAFIAHGGLLGMTEAIASGKPMVVVPFFGDQPANAAAAAAAGFAKVVDYYNLKEEDLSAALQSVLSPEMRMSARKVSKMWHDRESSPLETAVYWTERVLRWGHAATLHTAARDMPFYQLALLDVAAVFLLATAITILTLWFVLSKISRLFIKESKQKLH